MKRFVVQQLEVVIHLPVFVCMFCVQCVNAGMDTLTLARFVCELSLLEMQFVPVQASLLASACLLVALVTKDLGGWVSVSEHLVSLDTNLHTPQYQNPTYLPFCNTLLQSYSLSRYSSDLSLAHLCDQTHICTETEQDILSVTICSKIIIHNNHITNSVNCSNNNKCKIMEQDAIWF